LSISGKELQMNFNLFSLLFFVILSEKTIFTGDFKFLIVKENENSNEFTDVTPKKVYFQMIINKK